MQLDTGENGGQQSLTTDPVRATPANVAGQDPEFVDCDGLRQRFGIKRSLAVRTIARGSDSRRFVAATRRPAR
jgi:hypothetical protein